MNIKFDPIETESFDSSSEDDYDMLDTFKNSIDTRITRANSRYLERNT
jgi:hypothetical protein